MTELSESEPAEEVEFNVAADGTVAVGVACTGSPSVVVLSGPKLSGDPRMVVLSGLEDDAELAGRATIPWKELMMPRKAVRERAVEGILVSLLVYVVDDQRRGRYNGRE